MRLLPHPVTPVSPEHVSGLLSLTDLDPVGGLALAHQVSRWTRWGRGDVVVLGRPGRPDGAAWATGSLMPFGLAPRPRLGHDGADRGQLRALAAHARARLTRQGSVSGPAQDVEAVWPELVAIGQASREERWVQPLLVAPFPPEGLADGVVRARPAARWAAEGLRAARGEETGLVLPASVAMFVGELGYDPTASGGSYARHVEGLVAMGRSYVLLDDGTGRPPVPGGPVEAAFKADVGAMRRGEGGRPGVAQLTGVWTRDDLRGRGVATAALATTVDRVRAEHLGPDGIVSLYVNDFNTPAIGLYSGLGFERVGTYATVLL
ncbi:GNAT family N-acetyltransferase [Actinomyces haliotis]|uniref:GNAT family N-acetyltransferase n=1 Tax=Actinomyces haliotis TaxID=1280843 RepID=UPI00188E9F23|nr:GNAT family N-acetyltransferase [Actinomyces haliotis]